MCVVDYIFLDFLEQVGGKHKIVQGFVGCVEYLFLVANPFTMTLVDEHDILTNPYHGIHVVGVDDGGYIVFMCDVAQKFVNKNRCARVES